MAKFNLHELQQKLKAAAARGSEGKKIVYNGQKASLASKTSSVTKKGCGCGKR